MSTKSLEVYFLHSDVRPGDLHGRVAVPIDVLRANSTIITALAHGATKVIPCLTIDAARACRDEVDNADSSSIARPLLLGGERNCCRIDGFDGGNSPLDYPPQKVARKQLAFTTTNGTRAINSCKDADVIFLGAFLNLSSLCAQLAPHSQVALVCAGTDQQMTMEDILFAGCVAEHLLSEYGFQVAASRCSLSTNIAIACWQAAQRRIESGESLAAFLKMSRGGRNLMAQGMESDILFCSHIDRYDVVPWLCQENGQRDKARSNLTILQFPKRTDD